MAACARSRDGEGGLVFADRMLILLLLRRLIRPRWLCLAVALGASGGCDTGPYVCVRAASAFVVSMERQLPKRKTFHPQSERDKCLSGKVSVSASVCVGTREREGERLSLAVASSGKLSFLLPIRRELSVYFGLCHLQRKTQENATLEFLRRGADPFLLSETYRLL